MSPFPSGLDSRLLLTFAPERLGVALDGPGAPAEGDAIARLACGRQASHSPICERGSQGCRERKAPPAGRAGRAAAMALAMAFPLRHRRRDHSPPLEAPVDRILMPQPAHLRGCYSKQLQWRTATTASAADELVSRPGGGGQSVESDGAPCRRGATRPRGKPRTTCMLPLDFRLALCWHGDC